MDIKTLLARATGAGLRLEFDGELLRIKGPRKATAIAKELIDRRREIIEILKAADEGIATFNEHGENCETHHSGETPIAAVRALIEKLDGQAQERALFEEPPF